MMQEPSLSALFIAHYMETKSRQDLLRVVDSAAEWGGVEAKGLLGYR